MSDELLVLTTVPDEETAKKIARSPVEKRLAACVTRTAAGISLYWWQEKITEEKEIILFIKTNSLSYPELEKTLLSIHPYEVPEVIALPLVRGFSKYLEWLNAETGPHNEV